MHHLGFLSRLFSKSNQTKEIKKRDVLSIQIGDILEYDLVDYEVVGKITYREGKYKWYSYQLLGENKSVWLSAEMDDELELGIYEKIQLPEASQIPPKLEYKQTAYFLEEQGQAQVTGEGRSSPLTGQQMRYAEYSNQGETSNISVEDWGSEVEVSIGYTIQPYEIKIIAGSL
ncbi:DUF4178 domain-containing protein [Gracilibacillus alcaliphilus]|uniref:DUF4178 domain-containing protein n=1 Tax=Gracilibacillus alcaliphilus TaxID=1401441 RepID=UPI003083F6BD